MGWLKKLGEDYAKYLMCAYTNSNCALSIETWRTRKTGKYDWDKIKQMYPYLNTRQAKQVVEHAKKYIKELISDYLVKNDR